MILGQLYKITHKLQIFHRTLAQGLFARFSQIMGFHYQLYF